MTNSNTTKKKDNATHEETYEYLTEDVSFFDKGSGIIIEPIRVDAEKTKKRSEAYAEKAGLLNTDEIKEFHSEITGGEGGSVTVKKNGRKPPGARMDTAGKILTRTGLVLFIVAIIVIYILKMLPDKEAENNNASNSQSEEQAKDTAETPEDKQTPSDVINSVLEGLAQK